MITKLHTKILFFSVFVLFLAGCQMAGKAAPAQLSPVETAEAFYTWYLDYIQPGTEQMRNPLVDKAYRESPYLSTSMIAGVDALLESFEKEMGGGFDPFLLAQDFPQEIEVQAGEGQDTVIVRERFGENGQELNVRMIKQEGRWLIDDISRVRK